MDGLYQIVERQLPLLGGISGHNLLAVLDPNGNVVFELNGFATDPNGEPAALGIGWLPLYHRLRVFNETELSTFNLSDPGTEVTLFTGSLQQVTLRWSAALDAAIAINAKNFFYPPIGLGDNSNSVASTLIAAMGLTETLLPGVPFYRFVPGDRSILLNPATIVNIDQRYGILPTVSGSTRVVDLQRAVNNADGSVTIFTAYKDGTSTISHYSQNRFEETLYGVDGGELGNVSYSAAGSGKASATIRGQVGEVNFDNTNVTVLRGGQVTATGSGVNLLVMPNSTVQTTTFNSTLITAPGGSTNLTNLGSNNNLVLGLGTTVAQLGNNTIIGPVPPNTTDSGTGNTSLDPENLPLGTTVALGSSMGFSASIDEDDVVHVSAGGEVDEHSRTGLLGDISDIDGLAEQALRVLRDPREYREFGQADRALI